ncbi:MAG: hypothetical protein AB8H80_22700 [Planctomycetota bacterium]
MEQVYLYCAAIGGGLLALQVLLMLVGGGDADFDGDVSPELEVEVDASDAGRVLFDLSLKTIVAFITFFGIAGMMCVRSGATTGLTLAVAIGTGSLAFILVGQAMQALRSLGSSGNADPKSAIGQRVRVELRIPEEHTGTGKVLVLVGGRIVSRKAATSGSAIPTGEEVVIASMAAHDTYEVTTQR